MIYDLACSLSGYHRTEFEYPELAELPTFSAAWYRRRRDLHLARYPDLDVSTRANLDMFVDIAEQREAARPPPRVRCQVPSALVEQPSAHG